MSDPIKPYADCLRALYQQDGIKLKASHAHALVASYLGFSSKKAFQDSAWQPVCDQFLSLSYEADAAQVANQLSRMRDTEIKGASLESVLDKICAALKPPCFHCGTKSHNNIVINYIPSFDVIPPEDVFWVCRSCAQGNPSYDNCRHCGPFILHYTDYLNLIGECSEHLGFVYPEYGLQQPKKSKKSKKP